jgi:hypothetical protein
MPIYKDDFGSTVVHMGHGDVIVSRGRSQDKEHEDELLLFQSHRTGSINEKMPQGEWDERYAQKSSADLHIPVRIIFDKIESIDAIIETLQELKEGLNVLQSKSEPVRTPEGAGGD